MWSYCSIALPCFIQLGMQCHISQSINVARCIEAAADSCCLFCSFCWAIDMWFIFGWLTNKKLIISHKKKLILTFKCHCTKYAMLQELLIIAVWRITLKQAWLGPAFVAYFSRARKCRESKIFLENGLKCPGNVLEFQGVLEKSWKIEFVIYAHFLSMSRLQLFASNCCILTGIYFLNNFFWVNRIK